MMLSRGAALVGALATMTLAHWLTLKLRAKPAAGGGVCSQHPQRLVVDQQRTNN